MGFGFLNRAEYFRRQIHVVTLIGGSEPTTARRWKSVADTVSATILRNKWALVYCGMGSGIAGRVATSVLDGGGTVTAVLVRGAAPPDVPSSATQVWVSDFHERQRALFDLGDGALVIPGGVGTLSEFATLAAWRGAGLYPRPVVLFDPVNWFGGVQQLYRAIHRAHVSRAKPTEMFERAANGGRITFLLSKQKR